jgi:hypothetical protein
MGSQQLFRLYENENKDVVDQSRLSQNQMNYDQFVQHLSSVKYELWRWSALLQKSKIALGNSQYRLR